MFTVLFFIKASAILLSLIVLGYVFLKRIKLKNKPDGQFKHNISLMRDEKLLMRSDKKLQRKRQQLLKKIKFNAEVDQKKLINKSKKLGVPAGEILLAAKIQMSCK